MVKKELAPVAREYTIAIARAVSKKAPKKKAPTALKKIREFAKKQMNTQDVRIDVKVNKYIWARGIRNVPRKIRVRLTRKRNEDEDAKEKMYTLVTHVPVSDFSFLATDNVKEQ